MPEDRRGKKQKKETIELRCLSLKNKTQKSLRQNKTKQTLFTDSLHSLLLILKYTMILPFEKKLQELPSFSTSAEDWTSSRPVSYRMKE